MYETQQVGLKVIDESLIQFVKDILRKAAIMDENVKRAISLNKKGVCKVKHFSFLAPVKSMRAMRPPL